MLPFHPLMSENSYTHTYIYIHTHTYAQTHHIPGSGGVTKPYSQPYKYMLQKLDS